MSDTTAGCVRQLARSRARAGAPPARRLHGPGVHLAAPHGSSGGSTGWAGSTRTRTSAGRSTCAVSGVLGGLGAVPVRVPAAAGPPVAGRWACRPSRRPLAWNTAASFVTNTNWQAYSGESTMGHLVQMAGLAVQNFVSAAVGIVVAIALVRGFVRRRTDRVGNFWVDLIRACAADPAPDRRRRGGRADRRRRRTEPALPRTP